MAQVQYVDFGKTDPVFARIRADAEETVRKEPELAGFIMATVLNHETLESAIVHRVAARLDHQDVPGDLVRQAFMEAIARDASIGEAFRADRKSTRLNSSH